ncbi:MAG: hypothetical protein ACOH12_05550 [Parvibaculaceae bacterium]
MKDIHSKIKTVQTLDPANTTAARSSAPVDRQGFESVEHVVMFGASADTLSGAKKFDVRLEASEDGTTWANVTDAKAVNGGPVDANGYFATVSAAGLAQKEYRIGYVGNARYSRVSLVLTGTHTNGTPVSALAVLGAAHVKPVV